jgi:hypothetical protein
MKRRCLKCGAEWEIKGPIAFREECPECAVFVHTCANCAHFDANNRNCRIPTTEPVSEWSEMNFCEEFEYGFAAEPATGRGGKAGPSRGGPAARPADKPSSEEDARRRFENLFQDPDK